jgi:hypothetical protein
MGGEFKHCHACGPSDADALEACQAAKRAHPGTVKANASPFPASLSGSNLPLKAQKQAKDHKAKHRISTLQVQRRVEGRAEHKECRA